MLIPEVAQRKTIDEALSHCWLLVEVASAEAPVQDTALPLPLEESASTASLLAPLNTEPQVPSKTLAEPGGASDGATPRMEVPTPPCARTPVTRTPVKSLSIAAPRTLPVSVPALPPSTPTSTRTAQVSKLVVSGALSSTTTPMPTPKQSAKHSPHATPISTRCRRSETAPSPLSTMGQVDTSNGLPSSRVQAEPPSPIASSRTPLTRTPITTRVKRAQTAIPGHRSSPMLDSTVYTLECLDEMNFRNPALQECEARMANMVRQLESKRSTVREQEGNSRGSSVGVRYDSRCIKEAGTVPDLRTFTELVRTCGQTMRRASTAVGEEVTTRRASYELRRHEVARSVTLKPRSRRRDESPLRAGVGALALPLGTPSTNCSVAAPACSVSVPSTAMSVSAPSGISAKSDLLSRTAPSDFITTSLSQHSYGDKEHDGETFDKLTRTAVVHARPLSVSISSATAPLKPAQAGGYPQRLTASSTSQTVERLSPRPYVTTSSTNRSPLIGMRAAASPPATPGPDTYRDVMLARCATVPSVPLAVPTTL